MTEIINYQPRYAEDFKKLVDEKGLNFNKELGQTSRLSTLSDVITYKQFKDITLSFFNVNGDMEYSPQQSSFLTDFRRATIPLNKQLDFEHAKKSLEEAIKTYNKLRPHMSIGYMAPNEKYAA